MSGEAPYAALDVGSNTIRLLVAWMRDGDLEPIVDDSEFVRLGLGVDKTGALAPERLEAGLAAIARLAKEARDRGAQTIAAIATSAVRDARNGRELVERARQDAGVEIEIISGEREAHLTFLGATLGLPISRGAIVCDLGGGSAELIYADGQGMRWATSVQLGSGRLTERFVEHDPPTSEDLEKVAAHVRGVLADVPPAQAEVAIFTGGTASHITWLAGLQGVVEHVPVDTLEDVIETLTLYSAEQIVDMHDIKLERAQVLPAGATALRTIAAYYQVADITITRHGIREGTIVDQLRRDRAEH